MSLADTIEQQAQEFVERYDAVRAQLQRVIVGHDEVIHGVLTCIFVGGHCLLEGVPGLGKTLLVRTLAETLDLPFSRIQFTPDLMPADILGTNLIVDLPEGGRRFQFQKGPIFTQICLADEINRATPKTQSALLETMQEASVTVAGTHYELQRPFFVLATQNPIEQEGTYPLPEAQLDRFFFKLIVGYSSREELSKVIDRTTRGVHETPLKVMDGPEIVKWQRLVREVIVAPHVQDYMVRLVLATHPEGALARPITNQYVRWGASPRGPGDCAGREGASLTRRPLQRELRRRAARVSAGVASSRAVELRSPGRGYRLRSRAASVARRSAREGGLAPLAGI